MAKLAPKDPQFGIPIASRIDSKIAFWLNDKAGYEGKSLSRYIAEFITKASIIEKRAKELEAQLFNEREKAKKTIGAFIIEISKGDKKRATELIQIYNKFIQNEKSK